MPTVEELERENQRLRALVERATRETQEAEKREEKERQQREEAEKREEKERQQREEAEKREEKARQQREEAEKREEKARQQREEAEKREEELLKWQRPTRFLEYLSLVDEHLFTSLNVERDPYKTSAPGTTDVGGRFYPQHFRAWTDFSAAHVAVFERLAAAFGNDATFPSRNAMQALGENLSPKVSDETDLRPFLRNAVEKPAESIVTRYLQATKHATLKGFKFRNNSYGVDLRGLGLGVQARGGEVEGSGAEESGSAPGTAGVSGVSGAPGVSTATSTSSKRPKKKQRSPTKEIGNPDRWGFAEHRSEQEINTHVLVGEYKAAHKLHASKLQKVLAQPPGDDFFVEAAREDAVQADTTEADTTEADTIEADTEPGFSATPTATAKKTGRVFVARVLCQAYHYMISSGLEYGYVASGEGLVLLRVREDDANTLYYFWRVFAPTGDGDERATPRPQNTAAGYLASLAMMGLRSAKRPETWIKAREKELRQWPQAPWKALKEVPRLSFRLKDGDSGPDDQGGSSSGGGDAGYLARSRNRSPRKRGRSPSPDESGGGSAAEQTSTRAASGLLPFCTQACLLGLSRQLPLDPRCPNVHLHREARARRQETGQLEDGDGHALNEHELLACLVEQAKTDRAVNMRSLERLGLFGRFGALVRITVAGFGYTFVAKGIMRVFRGVLEHELAVYQALSAHQGRLIPVCLGIINLPDGFFPGPRCVELSQLLLLSFAGPDLSYDEALPYRIDIQGEMDRTGRELRALGLCNDDVRIRNAAWNEEVQRVMYFDFDQAYFEESAPSSPDSLEPSEPARTVEPSELGTPEARPSELSTPGPSKLLELPELELAESAPSCETSEPSDAGASHQHSPIQQAPLQQLRPLVLAKRDFNQFCDGSSLDA